MWIVHLAKFKCRAGYTKSDIEYYGVAYGLQHFDRTAALYSILVHGAALWHSIHPVVVSTIFRHDLNFVVTCSLAAYGGLISPW